MGQLRPASADAGPKQPNPARPCGFQVDYPVGGQPFDVVGTHEPSTVTPGTTPPALIRAQTKLPVLIHGETVYVDDAGIWYARTRAQADRLWRLMEPRNSDLNAFRLLPLQSAEVYAREAIRLLGAGPRPLRPQILSRGYGDPAGRHRLAIVCKGKGPGQ